MKIADLFFKASLDDSRLAIDAKKSGEKAGAAAATGYKSRFSTAFKQGVGLGVGVTAFSAIGMAIQRVTSFLGDSAEAYREEQVSVAKLTTALRANVDGWDGNTRAIEKVLAERMKLGFSDDEQRQSLGELVAAYGEVNQALAVQRTAMDLARFSGVDLATAGDTLIKVHAGNYRALKALGIQTENIHSETEALAAIQKVAGGQAEAYANTIEGKLLVAEVKAGEASEKFGQSIARLQADVLPLAADALSGLADVLDAVQTGFDETLPTGQRFDALLQGIESNFVADLIPGMNLVVDAGKDVQQSFEDSNSDAHRLGISVEDLAGELDDAQDPASDLTIDIKSLGAEAKDTKEAIGDLAEVIADELFGDAINAGNESRLKEEIRDLKKQREEVKRGTPEWIQLTGEIAENQQQLFELQLQMKEKEGPRAVIAWLKQQRDKFGDTSGVIQKLINKYRTLLGLQSQIANSPIRTGYISKVGQIPLYAEGGHYEAGVPRIVGEDGPEFDVPDHSGTIYPDMSRLLADYSGAPTSTNTWSSGMTIENLNVDARGATNPAATGTAVRQGVHDAMADVLRQQTARLPSGTRS